MTKIFILLLLANTVVGQYSNYNDELDNLELNATVCFSATDCQEMAVIRLRGVVILTTLDKNADYMRFVISTVNPVPRWKLYYNDEDTGQTFDYLKYPNHDVLIGDDTSDRWVITITYYE